MRLSKFSLIAIGALIAWLPIDPCAAEVTDDPWQTRVLELPLKDANEKLEQIWRDNEKNRFFRIGQLLCRKLRADCKDRMSTVAFVETALMILQKPSATKSHPIGTVALVDAKVDIAKYLLTSGYLENIPDPEYVGFRMRIIKAVSDCLTEVRKESASPLPPAPISPLDYRYPVPLTAENKEKIKKLNENIVLANELSLAGFARRDLPKVQADLERMLPMFLDFEYRRMPPTKQDVEEVISSAQLALPLAEHLRSLAR